MNQGYPPCPYCESGVLVPSSDYSVPWVCTRCGSNLTRTRDMYGPAQPEWYTRDGRPLRFVAEPRASAVVHLAAEKPEPPPEPPPAKKPESKGGKGKAKS